MTSLPSGVSCVLCDNVAMVAIDPPRRTLARGVDPEDSDYSVTVILPDVSLCADHHRVVAEKSLTIGWCDDERCRRYGEVGAISPCGSQFTKLGPKTRT